jgi:hypothetical protein
LKIGGASNPGRVAFATRPFQISLIFFANYFYLIYDG